MDLINENLKQEVIKVLAVHFATQIIENIIKENYLVLNLEKLKVLYLVLIMVMVCDCIDIDHSCKLSLVIVID